MTHDARLSSLEDRIGRIEARLANVEQHLERLVHRSVSQRPSSETGPADQPHTPKDSDPAAPAVELTRTPGQITSSQPSAQASRMGPVKDAPALDGSLRYFGDETPSRQPLGVEGWISWVGIGLLLLGVVLLFKYAVDQGWLTPSVRVAFGIVLGVALAIIGSHLRQKRRRLAQILLGGASAAWYITGFAAFQLFDLVPHAIAFAFMVLVTAYTLLVGMRQDESVLAVLGAVGGLVTPFLLYTDAGTVTGLVAYTTLVLSGAIAIYLAKGWSDLFVVSLLGGAVILFLGYAVGMDAGNSIVRDRWSLQLGVVLWWLMFWIAPLWRELAAERRSRKQVPLGAIPHDSPADVDSFDLYAGAVLAVSLPMAALFFSRELWTVDDSIWGWLAAVLGLGYATVSFRLRRSGAAPQLISGHSVAAAALTAVAISLLLKGHALILTLALQAIAVHYLAKRGNDRTLTMAGHVLFAVVAAWLVYRLVGQGRPDVAVANTQAVVHLAIIGIMLATSIWIVEEDQATVYGMSVHVLILAWLWRELSVLPQGQGVVTVAWGIYAIAVLTLLRREREVGIALLFLVVGKLFLVDLRQLEPIWRILLFLGFGAALLFLSYHLRHLWQPEDQSPP